MAQYFDLPVYKASYDLLLGIFQFTKNFSKEYKYTVGEQLKKETIELIVGVYKANSSQEKVTVLQKSKENIEVIRLLVRVMKDLRQINLPAFVSINEKVEMVSKQINGWQKSQK